MKEGPDKVDEAPDIVAYQKIPYEGLQQKVNTMEYCCRMLKDGAVQSL